MTRRSALSLTLAMLIASGGSPVFAHPGHDHKVLGTVTMAAADHVMVKDTAGTDVTILITTDTKVVQVRKAMKVEDIKSGMRVAITAVTVTEKDVETLVAKTIELGAAPTRK